MLGVMAQASPRQRPKRRLSSLHNVKRNSKRKKLNVANLVLELLQLFLQGCVLLCHLLVFLFPLIAFILERLDLALKVSCLDVGLAKPE